MKGFIISACLHLASVCALFFQWPAASPPVTPPRDVVKLFTPADVPREAAPPQQRKIPGPSAPQPRKAARAESKARLDLATVQLTIEDDTRGELMAVLKRYGGKIVVLDPATRTVQVAFSVSTAKSAPGVALTDGLPIMLGDPHYWPDVIALVHEGHADATVCALFPPSFVEALGAAIQKKAAELGVTDIKEATVAFAASQGCGIVIRHVA